MKSSGLYIHIPFCVRKCLYCDFPSYAECDFYFEAYIDALLKEGDKYRGERVDTVFIGGGTPTVLSPRLIQKLLSGINNCFSVSDDAEFSVEANPGTVTAEKLEALQACGVNRISVGVQSVCDRELQALGRIHNGETALETLELVKKYFDNVNADIMMSIPYQTRESLIKTLEAVSEKGVTHMSCYSLIIEEGTPFYKMYEKGELSLPSEDEDREMFSEICGFLKEKGFERYEISNFAKVGKESRHNLKYWNTEDYIGVGAGAHSCINGKRFYNTSDLEQYISAPGEPEEVTELTLSERMAEYVMMALRTTQGVNFKEFKNRFKIDFKEVYFHQLEKFKQTDFVKMKENGFALTEKGFDVSNAIMCEFV